MNLILAQKISTEIIEKLAPYCLPGKCLVAGSTRRKCSEVNDIEIVLLRNPKYVADFKHLVDSWKYIKGESIGRMAQRYYKASFDEYDRKIDIFMPQPNDFWRQFAIRTGSMNFSHNIIANAWTKLGWVGTESGLRRESECKWMYTDIRRTKKKWKCVVKSPTLPPAWESEEEFFHWLGIPYVEPEKRI